MADPLEPTERFTVLDALHEVPGRSPADRAQTSAPGRVLAGLVAAAPGLKQAVVASGTPTAVVTCDLVTRPWPADLGLWLAARSPAPLLWRTHRMLVVQWRDHDGRLRTLLWQASDHDQVERTPAHAMHQVRSPLPRLTATHGTVRGHLRSLGIAPADVDYLAFGDLQAEDLRRLVGTTRPAPDLGSREEPLAPWFSNATLIVHRAEWAAVGNPHPLQAPWYQPETFPDLPRERVAVVDGEVLLGPGVALVSTPGRTSGHLSLVLHTDTGVWVCSGNGVAAESWAPRVSRIPGVRAWSVAWGQEVVMSVTARQDPVAQYDGMLLERLLADPADDAPVPQCLASGELAAHRLAPGLAPTFRLGGITHGQLRGTSLLAPGA